MTKELRQTTGWGGRLRKRFCNMFSESSTGNWAELQLPCCPSKQGELPENMLQNLFSTCRPRLCLHRNQDAATSLASVLDPCVDKASFTPQQYTIKCFHDRCVMYNSTFKAQFLSWGKRSWNTKNCQIGIIISVQLQISCRTWPPSWPPLSAPCTPTPPATAPSSSTGSCATRTWWRSGSANSGVAW